MNRMKEVAALLGVEIGEEFGIEELLDTAYRLTEMALEEKVDGGTWEATSGYNLQLLLNGTRQIIKKPWKPASGEQYWFLVQDATAWAVWGGSMMDMTRYAVGNCFRTEEEAEAHKEEVLARLKKIYDEGKPMIGADEWQS